MFQQRLNVLVNLVIKRQAGHSKWQNIRHIKGEKDEQRGKLFTKFSQQMKVAIQEGGSINPEHNLKLEQVIAQAKRFNMPSATIQNIIKTSEKNKEQRKSHLVGVSYRGPSGSVILCEIFTDNLTRFRQVVTSILKKNSSKLCEGGSSHLFTHKGVIETELLNGKAEGELSEVVIDDAIESGAEDVKVLENVVQFFCDPFQLKKVQNNLEKLGYKIISASDEHVPSSLVELNDSDIAICASLCSKLEALEEVVRLHDNIL